MNTAYDTQTKPVYISINDTKCFSIFTNTLYDYFTQLLPQHDHQLVIICIGTDRATGDSLGPLVGYKLADMHFKNVTVLGTLDTPVHAKNLQETMELVKEIHPHALILAIDACLGTMENVGSVCIGSGGIKPGAGVKKDLPSVGDFHITGIVNFSSLMNMVVLQNTRLSTVMRMADAITSSLRHSLWHYYKNFPQL